MCEARGAKRGRPDKEKDIKYEKGKGKNKLWHDRTEKEEGNLKRALMERAETGKHMTAGRRERRCCSARAQSQCTLAGQMDSPAPVRPSPANTHTQVSKNKFIFCTWLHGIIKVLTPLNALRLDICRFMRPRYIFKDDKC